MPKLGIITQARMTSTRLPGKILLKANNRTILEHHISRLKWSKAQIFVATTVNRSDEPVVDICESLGFSYFRGDEHNVLERFYQCAEQNGLDVVIRVTSDCPLIDGGIIRSGIEEYMKRNDPNLYYSNCLIRTYPRGLDFEIFSFHLLKEAYLNATIDLDKEHVTPYINQNRSGRVTIVDHVAGKDFSHLRWTLDTEEDWTLIKSLIEEYKADALSYEELLSVVENNPKLAIINSNVKQKYI
ncbi:MAG: glycosyltransferase family protein [Cyclobacteriaceae bacterium]|nr:glycosyltransferase family protein [Cyclobacteriaceae bacterium]